MDDKEDNYSGDNGVGGAVSKLDADKRKAFVEGFMGKASQDDPQQKKQAMLRRMQGSS